MWNWGPQNYSSAGPLLVKNREFEIWAGKSEQGHRVGICHICNSVLTGCGKQMILWARTDGHMCEDVFGLSVRGMHQIDQLLPALLALTNYQSLSLHSLNSCRVLTIEQK